MNGIQANLPTNRKFGLFFGFVFFACFAYNIWYAAGILWIGVFALLSAVMLVAALLAPSYLEPFNKLWFQLGLFLGKIVNPVIMGVIFFLLVTPFAVVMRISGRDELRLKMKSTTTHWKTRSPAGPEPSSFTNQY